MKLIDDSGEFMAHLALWASQNRTMEGFNVLALTSVQDGVQYEAVVYDFYTGDCAYIHDKGPFKNMQEAMGFIGAALDEIERQV